MSVTRCIRAVQVVPALAAILLITAVPDPAVGQTTGANTGATQQGTAKRTQRVQQRPTTTSTAAPAQTAYNTLKERINENTVSIISGNPNGGYLGIAYDISAAFDDGDNLRILPIVGKGAVQNLRDIVHLRGVDMGLVNTVTLSAIKESGELGADLTDRVAYITRLFEDELHLLAVPGVADFKDLAGKRINFSDAGSGAQLAARRIFKQFKMDVKEFNMGQADAIEMMKRGELDATFCTCLKPLRPYQAVKQELGFKLLSVPYESFLQDDYLPITMNHEDYPNLIPKDTKVETIAVPTVLAVFNWAPGHDRHRKLTKFIDTFFTNFEKLHRAPRHPRWKNVNVASTLPGWQRFSAAQEWLDRRAEQAKVSEAATLKATAPTAASQSAVDPVLARAQAARAAPGDPQQQEKLFQQFLEWSRTQTKQ
jgi:TRAP transporter TAXI family solute receptor